MNVAANENDDAALEQPAEEAAATETPAPDTASEENVEAPVATANRGGLPRRHMRNAGIALAIAALLAFVFILTFQNIS